MYHSYSGTIPVTVIQTHGLSGEVGYPGIVPECPSNCGTRDTQTHGSSGEVGHPGIVPVSK